MFERNLENLATVLDLPLHKTDGSVDWGNVVAQAREGLLVAVPVGERNVRAVQQAAYRAGLCRGVRLIARHHDGWIIVSM